MLQPYLVRGNCDYVVCFLSANIMKSVSEVIFDWNYDKVLRTSSHKVTDLLLYTKIIVLFYQGNTNAPQLIIS